MNWQRLCAPLALMLGACASQPTPPAPIVDRSAQIVVPSAPRVNTPAVPVASVDPRPATYIVKKGDTLYRVALDHGLAYRDLAAWNNLGDVNGIKVDQTLRLTPPDGAVEIRPLKTDEVQKTDTKSELKQETKNYPKAVKVPYGAQSASAVAALAEGPIVVSKSQSDSAKLPSVTASGGSVAKTASEVRAASAVKIAEKPSNNASSAPMNSDEKPGDWAWPTAGKTVKAFSEENRGIDISGKIGQSVIASANGKVVYAGSGLRGYGKMIILKHNQEFLTAYANNSKLFVKEGGEVRKGEKIAEMGNSDSDQVKLHFEMRRFGKPVDPAKYIQAEKK
ncbi:peptidoglycan DD-metalloendopeptidase family protein [Iodobacter fluviatilis]|uniref:Lipoprotein NlpD n=1 Tax=Iodobacter fluviatilis TaxID=537 RepID=A0A377QCN3_9NEIS|nr:peptidoglycan DD-metalloendopeptidase family protein [Iodobacter fluviatilis]TCU82416.1 lipoprotein NlpD [Iodobacter fluviatilis]STQ91641.1 Murein hydrolase activator NlpD precursor [Iodobacter fluviatilis]